MNTYMEAAIREGFSGMEEGEGGPFGAVIVQDGKIIAEAHNQVLMLNDPTAHAEMQAIRKASTLLGRFDLSDCEIYATGEPCPMCFSAIHWAKMKKCYFGNTAQDAQKIDFDDQFIYEVIRGTSKEIQVEVINIERERCLTLYEHWASMQDRRQY